MAEVEEYLKDLYEINRQALVKSEDPLELVYIDLRTRIETIAEKAKESKE